VESLETRRCFAIQNGGFEAFPDFANFELAGNGLVRGANVYAPVPEGEVQAVLSNGPPSAGAAAPVPASALETFLGLGAGTLDALGASDAIEGSAVKQTFTGTAGEDISFRYNLLTNHATGGAQDLAFFVLLPASPTVTGAGGAAVLARPSEAVPISPQNLASGFTRETGYRTHTFILPATGTFTLGFGVVDVDDAQGNSALLVDAITQSTSPPRASAVFRHEPRHRLFVRFTKNVSASLAKEDLVLQNLTTGAQVLSSQLALAYDPQTNNADFTFPGFGNGTLPNGHYRATLPAASVADAGGLPLPEDFVFDFFVLEGDVNRDRSVNGTDFAILAGNFGKTGMTFEQGDLNGDGSVTGSDFALLAGNFGKSVPVSQATVTAGPVSSAAPEKWHILVTAARNGRDRLQIRISHVRLKRLPRTGVTTTPERISFGNG
jgi:hypothetical protein